MAIAGNYGPTKKINKSSIISTIRYLKNFESKKYCEKKDLSDMTILYIDDMIKSIS